MSPDWLNQFTSAYASSIAYGISVVILSLLFKPIFSFFSRQIKQFSEIRHTKQQSKIILPAKNDVQKFSIKQKITESEWNDAISFLKNDIPLLVKDFGKTELPGDRIFSYVNKNMRTYQIVVSALAIINFVANLLFHIPFSQEINQIILAIALAPIVVLLVVSISLFISMNQEKSRVKKIKNQMRNAMEVLTPGMAFTYGQLGELLKSTKEYDLPRLQSELSDIGMPFNLNDMNFALFLITAPIEELLPIGERIATQVISQAQLTDLSPEQKKEFAQVFVDVLRLWPVSFQSEPGNSTKK